ncbi:hypothetical protein, partial [Pseudomonas amygdali]|uniref:hypothetical protein n=1 Tax=Pseudomonas amygdali TaxID=47877 RepID=UPI001C8F5DCF
MTALTAPDRLHRGVIQFEVDSGARDKLLVVRIVGIGVDGTWAPRSACLLKYSRIAGLTCAIATVYDRESLQLKRQSLVAR